MRVPEERMPRMFARDGTGRHKTYIGNRDEMVRHATGSINGGATTGRCFLSTPYSIDLLVKVDDLSNYGVRNYSPGTQQELCAP